MPNDNQDVKIKIVVNSENAKKGYDDIVSKTKQAAKDTADIQKAFNQIQKQNEKELSRELDDIWKESANKQLKMESERIDLNYRAAKEAARKQAEIDNEAYEEFKRRENERIATTYKVSATQEASNQKMRAAAFEKMRDELAGEEQMLAYKRLSAAEKRRIENEAWATNKQINRQMLEDAKTTYSQMGQYILQGLGIGTALQAISTLKSALKDLAAQGLEIQQKWANFSGLGMGADQINELRSGSAQLAPQLHLLNTELAQAEWTAYYAGAKTSAEYLNLVSNATIVSRNRQADLNRTIEVAGNLSREYNIPLSENGRLLALLGETSDKSRFKLDDVSNIYQRSALYAKNLGLSIEDLSREMGLLHSQGLNASQTGDVLQRGLQGIFQASERLKKEGFDFFETSKTKGFSAALAELKELTGRNIEGIEDLKVGSRQAFQVLELLATVTGDLNTATETLNNTMEREKSRFKEVNDTGTAAAKDLKIAWQDLGGALIDRVDTPLKAILADMTAFLQHPAYLRIFSEMETPGMKNLRERITGKNNRGVTGTWEEPAIFGPTRADYEKALKDKQAVIDKQKQADLNYRAALGMVWDKFNAKQAETDRDTIEKNIKNREKEYLETEKIYEKGYLSYIENHQKIEDANRERQGNEDKYLQNYKENSKKRSQVTLEMWEQDYEIAKEYSFAIERLRQPFSLSQMQSKVAREGEPAPIGGTPAVMDETNNIKMATTWFNKEKALNDSRKRLVTEYMQLTLKANQSMEASYNDLGVSMLHTLGSATNTLSRMGTRALTTMNDPLITQGERLKENKALMAELGVTAVEGIVKWGLETVVAWGLKTGAELLGLTTATTAKVTAIEAENVALGTLLPNLLAAAAAETALFWGANLVAGTTAAVPFGVAMAGIAAAGKAGSAASNIPIGDEGGRFVPPAGQTHGLAILKRGELAIPLEKQGSFSTANTSTTTNNVTIVINNSFLDAKSAKNADWASITRDGVIPALDNHYKSKGQKLVTTSARN